ncbi:MAG: hypothetical protein KDD36_02840 [Flavobacteriales bacterium]|nr:hypothetical protein [Flavobacteriales bacterium]
MNQYMNLRQAATLIFCIVMMHISSSNAQIIKGTDTLAVSWLYIDANTSENLVDVKWITDAEVNNDFFTVEVSTDGNSFEAIAKVKGSGTSPMTNYYNQTVEAASFLRYFRIRQTNFDGRSSFSDVIAVAPATEVGEFRVQQTPDNGDLRISFLHNSDAPAYIVITDLNGKMFADKHIQSQTGLNQVDLQNLNLTPQYKYEVTLVSGTSSKSQKILTR